METMTTVPLLKGDELTKGLTYAIRLTDGRWVRATFHYERHTNWLKSRTVTHFMFTNLSTGRTIEIKSRQRIRQIKVD